MNKYMEYAKDLADMNLVTKNGGPFGAVVVKDNIVIGIGNNNVLKLKDPTAHAEIMAIREACQKLNTYDLTGCELYTSCYPCPMCLSAIIWSNIKVVYYGNTKEDADEIGFRDDKIYTYFNHLKDNNLVGDILQLNQIDREETIKSFIEYKLDDSNKLY